MIGDDLTYLRNLLRMFHLYGSGSLFRNRVAKSVRLSRHALSCLSQQDHLVLGSGLCRVVLRRIPRHSSRARSADCLGFYRSRLGLGPEPGTGGVALLGPNRHDRGDLAGACGRLAQPVTCLNTLRKAAGSV